MSKAKHLLGISGGKDSAALAIYLNDKYPEIDFTYYFCDTGKELDETYQLIENLRSYLGKEIKELTHKDVKKSEDDPFDFFYKSFRGYLPSPKARWCTAMMKLNPFEAFVGNDPTISYVGIRGDEDRDGYISKKESIQSIFPFRKNIWSEDVLLKIFNPKNRDTIQDFYSGIYNGRTLDKVLSILNLPITFERGQQERTRKQIKEKLEGILDIGIADFNKATFDFLKGTSYPLARESDFPLLENEEVLVRDDIFRILEDSGVGVPAYYNKLEYEVDGQKGEYARSRSGCFFCFFQQKIEWIWLYEQHPDLFKKAMAYEKADELFTWNQYESLEELIQPDRVEQIKREHLNRTGREKSKGSKFLLDILEDTESDGCAACFI